MSQKTLITWGVRISSVSLVAGMVSYLGYTNTIAQNNNAGVSIPSQNSEDAPETDTNAKSDDNSSFTPPDTSSNSNSSSWNSDNGNSNSNNSSNNNSSSNNSNSYSSNSNSSSSVSPSQGYSAPSHSKKSYSSTTGGS
ncbi:hypothetical protein [Ectobacillus sp. sgz5001026]|uniref:hypothetical protein n=1 Tax=Ectobacillus sp. sgz5001026 TaxID=3242473 RepID=UPI0036D2D2C1